MVEDDVLHVKSDMRTQEKLARRAKEASLHTSTLPGLPKVGVAAEFSNFQIFDSTNIDCHSNIASQVCLEQAVLSHANGSMGPLSQDSGRDGLPVWRNLALWADVEEPIMPCGSCRDALIRSGKTDSEIISRTAGGRTLEIPISWLLPLAGLGEEGDVSEEIDYFRALGGYVSSFIPDDLEVLLDEAKKASESSWIPHFAKDKIAASGAALRMTDDTVVLGWRTQESTKQLTDSAIVTALRKALQEPFNKELKVKAAAFFSDSKVLRAPSGSDLQALLELSDGNIPLVFACGDGRKFHSSLRELLPKPF
ncbi:MAG: hypothetical protein GYA55_02760 [SAR324 cluster bacterium]|uniref:Uncharacterized protein n=1 Tax=SAR324 cluster bacterium TaxID=2024889 RepID=A0A7X9IJF3_9DELT|nr:hypothetical protein [SAR324 cluster bacterium]